MRTRIDFPNDGGPFATVVHLAAEYQRAANADEWAQAAGYMHRIEHLTEKLTDDALLRADEQTPRQRHQIARDMGIVHGTINNRIRRARERAGLDGGQDDETPAHLYLVHRKPDHGSDPEWIALHRTREGAQNRADTYNDRFGHAADDPFRANVRRVSGRFQQEAVNAPLIVEE